MIGKLTKNNNWEELNLNLTLLKIPRKSCKKIPTKVNYKMLQNLINLFKCHI